ncbi:unnamed protein product [Acanthoscelides obtectus]|uniref:EGF-like domain-containing protein n=1 Tax=Acanthoscelides obtectus TaxID=200917 RepID=A0A9P0LDN3_ACAOB|nr:unnamed protein product [Acanthoscelides obtectus]CAK1687776.1 hypothetical protein AOBTE_LOCUS36361 [Acanthoscelides obtectus]
MLRDKMLLCAGIVGIFVVFCHGAQLQGAPRGQFNHTRKGICILEVPTIDLLSPEDRHGANLRGNSSRDGYSKIEVCCSGYARKPHSHYECHPVCDGCEHGNCTAPGVCACKRGYILIRDTQHNTINDCVPTCPLGCLNGICTNTGACSCNAGTVPSKDGKYCLPHCTGGCGQGGHCTGPEHCTCDDGITGIARICYRCENQQMRVLL